MKNKRKFIDTPLNERCVFTIKLRDGTFAQCGRKKKLNELCLQHHKKIKI